MHTQVHFQCRFCKKCTFMHITYIYKDLYIHTFTFLAKNFTHLRCTSQFVHCHGALNKTKMRTRTISAAMELCLQVMNPLIPPARFIFLRLMRAGSEGRVGAQGLWILTPPTLPGNTLPVCGAQLLSDIFSLHASRDRKYLYTIHL